MYAINYLVNKMEWKYLPNISSIYDEKVKETAEYIKFLKLIIKPNSCVLYREPALKYQTQQLNKIYKEKKYNPSALDTSMLRSTVVLVIYNFMESISCFLMQDIHDHVFKQFKKHNKGWTLNRFNESLIMKIFDYINNKGYSRDSINRYLTNTSTSLDSDIIFEWLNNTLKNSISENKEGEKFLKWFSGNVDVRKIKEMILPFGIDQKYLENIANEYKRAIKLLDIKDGRNILAHGAQTFAEFGNDRTLEDIEVNFQCVHKYFDGLLDVVNDFLKYDKYLKNLNQ